MSCKFLIYVHISPHLSVLIPCPVTLSHSIEQSLQEGLSKFQRQSREEETLEREWRGVPFHSSPWLLCNRAMLAWLLLQSLQYNLAWALLSSLLIGKSLRLYLLLPSLICWNGNIYTHIYIVLINLIVKLIISYVDYLCQISKRLDINKNVIKKKKTSFTYIYKIFIILI